MGKVLLFEARRTTPELALSCIKDAVDHLTLLAPRVGMSAGDWNVHSTRAQFALGRALTAIEKTERWLCDSSGAHARIGREWEEISAKVKEEGRIVAALASALCSNSMSPVDRCQTQGSIAAEVPQLIAELTRARALFQKSA